MAPCTSYGFAADSVAASIAASTSSRAANSALLRNILMPGADNNLVDAADRGFAGSAKTAGHACQGLQFKRNMLENVAGPCSFLHPAQKATALSITAAVFDQRWKPGREPFVKTGNGIGRKILEIADVDDCLKHRTDKSRCWDHSDGGSREI